jgi:hypothetical protein
MPSPVKSQPDIRKSDKNVKDSSKPSHLASGIHKEEESSREIVSVEIGRLDFHPPQNHISRTSPPHKTRETKYSPLSSPFASSIRGGRSKRFSTVSEKDHEAAKRAAWEVTSKSRRHAEKEFPARKPVRCKKLFTRFSKSKNNWEKLRDLSPNHISPL